MKGLMESLRDGDNILITGGAGVGKTYHTNQIIEQLKKEGKKFAVCAMTGLASQHLHFGMTLHRFLQTGSKTKKESFEDLMGIETFTKNLESICHVSTIIIDEVSMMRSDFLELMNVVLMEARKTHNALTLNMFDKREVMPFGGYQIVMVGDFCQLPPVVPKGESVPCKWIFQHDLFLEAKFRVFNLTEIKRTSSSIFAETLNKIRVGYFDDSSFNIITGQNNKKLSSEGTVLMSRLEGVNFYNTERLKRHDGDELRLTGNISVREELKERLFEGEIRKLYRQVITESGLEKELLLKVGCKIMLLANNPDMGYSNGSQGIILGTKQFDEHNNDFKSISGHEYNLDYKYFGECIHVLLDNGEDVVVPKKSYSLFGNSFDDKGRRLADLVFYQYPITLGYAVSIHKSQGMSLSNMILDCSKIFAEGQFYVGLSRATSLEGLSILNFNTSYIRADEDAVNFYIKVSQMNQGEVYGE